MKKEMLINVLQPEECRIAIVEDGILEELYVERTGHESYVGNIYKGRIVNIEPGIQAAFVDFGVGRNGFLHVSDVEPTYYRHIEGFGDAEASEEDWGGGSRSESRQSSGSGDHRSDRGPRRDKDGGSRRGGRSGGRGPSPDLERRRQIVDELKKDLMESGFSETPADGADGSAEESAGAENQNQDQSRGRRRRRGQGPNRSPRNLNSGNSGGQESGSAHGGESNREPVGGREPMGDAPSSEGHAPDSQSHGQNDSTPPASPSMDSQARYSHPEGEPELGTPTLGGGAEEDDLLFTPRKANPAPQQQFAPPVEPFQPVISSKSTSVPKVEIIHLEEDAIIFSPKSSRPQPEIAAFAPPVETSPLKFETTKTYEHAPLGELLDEEPASVSLAELVEPLETEESLEGEAPIETAETVDPSADQRGQRNFRPRTAPQRGRSDGHRGTGPRSRGRDVGRNGAGRPKPPIQDIFKRGQEVIVQVIKEGIGSKGPTLSTYISIAGRYLVLMPGLNRVGISRKILDEGARRRLRDVFGQLRPPKGLGFIIRTAGVDKTKTELQRDLVYLSRLWQVVARRIKKSKSPAEVYQESDMITRTIRDTFTNDIDTIWVDEKRACEHAQEFLQFVMPQFADRIRHFEETEPLFHRYGLEEEIAKINLKKVPLPHGGSIVIDQTEALVAIDVNSGNFRTDSNNAEETAFHMNLAAAKEIARQLRLRDLGGVIVNDFIDMREEKHRRNVERALREAMKRDRARTKVLRISGFGIIEMTRQRIRPSLRRSVFHDCPFCTGIGQVKTSESMSLDVIRLIQLASHRPYISNVRIRVAEGVANFLLNKKRRVIADWETAGNMEVEIFGMPGAPPELLEVQSFDNHGNEVRLNPYAEIPAPRPRR